MITYIDTHALRALLNKQIEFQSDAPFKAGQRISGDCAVLLNNIGAALEKAGELQEYAGITADDADVIIPALEAAPVVHAHRPSDDPPALSGEEAASVLEKFGFSTTRDESEDKR